VQREKIATLRMESMNSGTLYSSLIYLLATWVSIKPAD